MTEQFKCIRCKGVSDKPVCMLCSRPWADQQRVIARHRTEDKQALHDAATKLLKAKESK